MKKYAILAAPMLLGIEVISILCLIGITVCFIADLANEAERRGV